MTHNFFSLYSPQSEPRRFRYSDAVSMEVENVHQTTERQQLQSQPSMVTPNEEQPFSSSIENTTPENIQAHTQQLVPSIHNQEETVDGTVIQEQEEPPSIASSAIPSEEVIRQMLEKNMEVHLIAEMFGLSEDEVLDMPIIG